MEWGILFSQGSSYSSRFPSDKWVFKLLECELATTLRLSGHLCNGLVEDIVDGEWTFLNRSYAGLFKRLQLNFHGDFWDIGESLFEGFLTPGLSDFEIWIGHLPNIINNDISRISMNNTKGANS